MSRTQATQIPRRVALPLLLLILVAGLVLRVWNLNFDQGTGSHPDERSTACFYATTMALPTSWAQFWEPHQSPMNPLWDVSRGERRGFTYGHLPLYLGVVMGDVFHRAAPAAAGLGVDEATVALMERADRSCDAIAVAGRLTIALFDTTTIFLLYLLGKRLQGRAAGLLAAAFYAFTAQAIQLSHFFAMDPASTTFTVLAVLAAVEMVYDMRPRFAVLTGVAMGLAIASKFSALPILALPVVAAGLALWRSKAEARSSGAEPNGRIGFFALLGVVLAWLVAVSAFFAASPYAVLDWQNFVQATLVEQGAMVRGIADFPFTRQYRNTIPYLYFIQQQVQWGLGWPLGIAVAAGSLFALGQLVVTLWRLLRAALRKGHGQFPPSAQIVNVLAWSWVIPYFGITGAFLAKFNRYMSPVLPFVALWLAWLSLWLWEHRTAARRQPVVELAPAEEGATGGDTAPEPAPAPTELRRPVWSRALAVALAATALAGGLFWSLAYTTGVYSREHTWLTASRWIYEHVPAGSVLLWELWDDPLPKSLPNEPGMDMGTQGLANIDWSPYEEDTAEKYAILQQKLAEADYVVYSSKRIYDSVDELPERYPMTNLYYDAMWDGRLGFELAAEFTSPPSLLGLTFDDRHADESWSLYDHPQVTVFRKVRDLSAVEMDALFAGSWESAVAWYRGPDSPLSPLLSVLGLGSAPGSENSGLINRVIRFFSGGPVPLPPAGERPTLMVDLPLAELPIVDDYRWNSAASNSTPLAVFTWWLAVSVLGWLAWPLLFFVCRPLRDRGFLLARTFGWLVAGWMLWWAVDLGVLQNSVTHTYFVLAFFALIGVAASWVQGRELWSFVRRQWPILLVSELLFAGAYLGFVWVRLQNPDLWQPWFGGEKQMEFAILNGVLRSATFPPMDPHFSGGIINYYYFGLYLVGYLIKLTGIYAEVAFNLALPTVFAMTVTSTFALAYSAVRGDRQLPRTWHVGLVGALLAPLFVTLMGNLDGIAQIFRLAGGMAPSDFQSAIPGLKPLVDGVRALPSLLLTGAELPPYDFWGPSRVIPDTINEFPWWSFLFADLHPHIIGIPLSAVFLSLIYVLICDAAIDWRKEWRYGVALLFSLALMLGAMAVVNLWELPTYLGVGILAFLVSQYWGRGTIRWGLSLAGSLAFGVGAYFLFYPFFRDYVNVGASGVGLVQEPDPLGLWLLIWGFLLFMVFSWLLYAATRPALPIPEIDERGYRTVIRSGGVERAVALFFRRFDRLPVALYRHGKMVQRPALGYLFVLSLLPLTLLLAVVAWLAGRTALALVLPFVGLAFALLWRRGRSTDAGGVFATLAAVTALALLAGTQIVYLRDFLDNSPYYRMNTLFKFFNQAWVLLALASAIAMPRLWGSIVNGASGLVERVRLPLAGRVAWAVAFVLLLGSSLAYTFFGTPARLEQRFPGWQPEIGTLNGLDYMIQGSYAWPDESNRVELRYEWEAVQWLLANVRGHVVIAEAADVDYYRVGGTRIASYTGLSGLRGMHEQEQRYPEDVGYRDGIHREFWATPSWDRTQELIDELEIGLIYVGQLERYQHPEGTAKIQAMADAGLLTELFRNERAAIYAVPERLEQAADGRFYPVGG